MDQPMRKDNRTKVLLTPGYLTTLAARGFVRLSETRLKPVGLGVGYLPVLAVLRDKQPCTQRDLATILKVEQPPMAQMLTRLERDGLVVRAPDRNDRRSQNISMTERAKALYPEALNTLIQGNKDALTGFSKDEETQFVSLLLRVIANLEALSRTAE
jgi:DNA-binding MarR family transcriptional regulator